MRIFWISRHALTEGQTKLIEKTYHIKREDIIHANITFPYNKNAVDEIKKLGARKSDLICIVAPTYVMVDLLNAEYRLLEFVNEPSSRQRGKFLCRGAFEYMVEIPEKGIVKRFIPCPLSLEEQEEVDLMTNILHGTKNKF